MRMIGKILDVILIIGLAPLALVSIYALLDALLVSRSAVIDKGLIDLARTQSDMLFSELDSEYVIA